MRTRPAAPMSPRVSSQIRRAASACAARAPISGTIAFARPTNSLKRARPPRASPSVVVSLSDLSTLWPLGISATSPHRILHTTSSRLTRASHLRHTATTYRLATPPPTYPPRHIRLLHDLV